jgi:hypothetical protein
LEQNTEAGGMYEYTSQLSLTPDLAHRGAINNIIPAQIILKKST